MKIKMVLFDLDGTVTDPKEGITKAVRYALNHYGIDVNSLEICSADMVNDIIKQYPMLKAPLAGCSFEGLTNAQIYRTYIMAYLKKHPLVNASLDIIISQKEATPYGMPIEVYFFLKDKVWNEFETIQSDIFDHLLAMAPEFGLRLYQLSTRPS